MSIVIVFLVLYLGINSWLFIALMRMVQPLPPIVKVAIAVVYWLLTLSFFAMQFYRHRPLSSAAYHHLYQISTSWIVVVLYMTIFYGCASLLQLMGLHIPHSFPYCIVLTTVVLIYGNWHFNNPTVKHLAIELQGEKRLPEKTKIVAFSDIHLGYGINRERLEKYVRIVNEAEPDIILIGGDLIDTSVAPLWSENMHEVLNRLKAPLGIYMVMGNHDYMSGFVEVDVFIKQTNIQLLRDSVVSLPSGLQIIGHDDKSNSHRKTVAELVQLADIQKPIIYINHQPDNSIIDEVSAEMIDFAFFGHTHKGQFFPINIVVRAMYRLHYGHKEINNTHFFVSSGLGLWGPPFRIGSDSEIVVIDLN